MNLLIQSKGPRPLIYIPRNASKKPSPNYLLYAGGRSALIFTSGRYASTGLCNSGACRLVLLLAGDRSPFSNGRPGNVKTDPAEEALATWLLVAGKVAACDTVVGAIGDQKV